MKKYQVWLIVEEWENDNKICNIEAFLVGEHKNMDKAIHLWATLEGIAVSLKESLQVFFKAPFERIE